MKHTATLVVELKGTDIDNRIAIRSLMMWISMMLDQHPIPNITHWELKSFDKAK